MGKSYFIGNNKYDLVKLDLFYTEPFVFPCSIEQNIRFASIEEVSAMKLEIIAQGGRKKDFWDIHEILDIFTLDNLIDFYLKRNPYGYSKDELLTQIIDFYVAEDDFTPNCYKDKDWEIIKLDFEELIKNYKPICQQRIELKNKLYAKRCVLVFSTLKLSSIKVIFIKKQRL
ncbi:hypothetical protein A8C32_05115 [Flavivirga aquatica]|uniref:Nucleotidyl transferase AbiEii/AbiGii toxin family protein n=1 Tax=Flavivirga aquatica TaxID=1849968 RepID=A0A1E5SHJ2_9FLAO|nr:nucleotidyl transferase AbiEii/AbiGii toxin family protein [Flavivirga aquatica]OEJ98583.1 hypothetical protein A8C32_05115 [Flavivirga aquatica]